MSELSILRSRVNRVGFHLFHWDNQAPLSALALKLGHPVPSVPGRPAVDLLVPKDKESSSTKSLSSIHGTDAFPFHTETAHWREPVDWVILKCVNPGAGHRPTLLIDAWDLTLEDDEITRLTRSLMVVKNGSKSFLAPLATRQSDRISFRYDPGCMKPASISDMVTLDILKQGLTDAAQTAVAWQEGQYLILDNRRMLHSRAGSPVADPDRNLERVYVTKVRR